MWRYISKEIPPYPNPVEFWVSDVTHVTEESGFDGIFKSEQIRPPESEFSWWDLKINKEAIRSAEERYVESHFPKEQQVLYEQNPFLEKFTTSPLFQPEKSRYGNYRFTFPLTELMKLYKEQNCGGKEPVLRMYETITYKQEIVYTVLIHSPEDNKKFKKYPLLEASERVQYRDGAIIWKAQAICETHHYQFCSGEVQLVQDRAEFYVWDLVSLVFHLPEDSIPCEALKFRRRRLIEALEACDFDNINRSMHSNIVKKINSTAKMKVSELKKELKEDEEEEESKEDDKIKKEEDDSD
ncbi:hypothetical protein C0J50_17685 [Silurus asotus]|uniref:Uncharacterized protein n=1 Tax=Silurus asotus TaxID=30991 RepID=A0AAD5AWF9_SILAS|nr:hypothetical protein C0J50_17685 [Silurus asotus]